MFFSQVLLLVLVAVVCQAQEVSGRNCTVQERVNLEKTLENGARNKIFKNTASVFTIWLIAEQGKPTTETESPFQPAESRRTNR